MRFTFTRDFYIPAGARKVADKHSDAVAYLYERQEKPYAVTFVGKQQKPLTQYRYLSTAERESAVARVFKSRQSVLAYKADQKAKTVRSNTAYKIGDILSTSWGYEQTNVDFYQVVGLAGKATLILRQIGGDRTYTQSMAGQIIPVPGSFLKNSPELRVRVTNGSAKIGRQYASKVEAKLVDGSKVYESQYFSEYA